MAHSPRPLSPHLQIYKPQYSMVLSISHRLTGLILSVSSLFLVCWLWAIASGPERYENLRRCMSAGWVKLLLVGLLFCFFYHLCNGIRHLAWDLGYGFEKPQARASGWAVVIAAVVLTAAGAVLALRLLGGTA